MSATNQLDLFTFSVNRQPGRPAVVFTPAFFKSVYKQYRDGNLAYLIEMMRQSEIDSYVSGCLKGRRAGFKRDWVIEPASSESRDTERAAWLTEIFKNLQIRDLLEDIQDPLLYAYKVIDFEWDVRDGKQVVLNHVSIDQAHFKVDSKDSILKIDWGGRLEEIPDTALVCRNRKQPDMLPVTRDFILKNFGLDSWASFLETFGEPFILGKYPPGSDQDVKDELQKGLDALARSSRGIIPEGSTVEIVEAAKSTADHEKFHDACNRGIAITLLGHANSVEQSGGAQIGENLVPWRAGRAVADDDMAWCEQWMDRLIRMHVDRNFGDGRYAHFRLSKKDPPSTQEVVNALDTAYRHGVELAIENYTALGIKVTEGQGPVKREPSVLDY